MIAFASVCTEVEAAYTALFLCLVTLSVYLTHIKKVVISRWSLNALSLAIIIFSIYRFNINALITQMLEALLVLLAIKFLEEKKVRDYMQIYAISLLVVAGSGLISLSM